MFVVKGLILGMVRNCSFSWECKDREALVADEEEGEVDERDQGNGRELEVTKEGEYVVDGNRVWYERSPTLFVSV